MSITLPARLSSDIIIAIEQALGTGMISIARKLTEGQLTLKELSTIIALCQGAQDRDALRESIVHHGLGTAVSALAEMFARVLQGNAENIETLVTLKKELHAAMAQFPDYPPG